MRGKKISILLVLLFALYICFGQAIFASNSHIKISTSVGIDGQYKYGRYIPINITLENTGKHFSGTVRIRLGEYNTEYIEEINVASGDTKTVKIPIWGCGDYCHDFAVSLVDQANKEIAKQTGYLPSSGESDDSKLIVGILTESFNKLSYFSGINFSLNDYYHTKTIVVEADDIDEKVNNLEMLDILVINNYNTSMLRPEQVATIEKWVEQGGTLIIGTGINGIKTVSSFSKEFLPMEVTGTTTENIQIMGESLKVELADFRYEGERNKVNKSIYNNLYESFIKGAGKIIAVKYDLGSEPMVSFTNNRDMWKRILVDEELVIRHDEISGYNTLYNFQDINNEDLPAASTLSIILIGYIILIGIISYFVVKKKGKKEYIWVVAPISSLIVTGITYLIAMRSALAPYVVKELDIVHVTADGNASRSRKVAILCTQGKDIEIVEPKNTSFNAISSENVQSTEKDITQHLYYEGDKVRFVKKDCSVCDELFIATEAEEISNPNYTSQLITDGQDNKIIFKNTSGKKINRLFVTNGYKIWDLGEIAVDQEVQQSFGADGSNDYDTLRDKFSDDEDLSYLVNILDEIEPDIYNKYNPMSYLPEYVAVTEIEDYSSFVENEYMMNSCYQMTIGEMEVDYGDEGEVFYPYDYFMPVVERQSGTGYVDEESPIMTINGDLSVDLTYYIDAVFDIKCVSLILNSDAVQDYYWSSFHGEVYIFNYDTANYELIDLYGEYFIEGETLASYVRDNAVKVRVIGQGEDSALVPSIAVRGERYAEN